MKAILVIDMPQCCAECELCYHTDKYGCMVCEDITGEIVHDWYRKPLWCPLIPLEAYDAIRDELKKRMEHPERYSKR